jgi:hypothetical protein
VTAQVLRQPQDGAERVIPMSRRDRLVRGQVIVGVVGPIDAPDASDLTDALRQLVMDGYDPRVGYGFAEDGKNWSINDHTPADWCEEMVVSIPSATPETILAVAARQVWRVDTEHPVRFVLSGDYVIQVADQAIGDGVEFLRRMSDVLGLATGVAPVAPRPTGSPRFPLLAVLRASAGRPHHVLSGLVDRATRRTSAAVGTASPGTTAAHGITGTPRASTVPRYSVLRPLPRRRVRRKTLWHPDVVVAAASTHHTVVTRLRRWAQASTEPTTFSAVLSALLRRAFERSGVPLAEHTAIVVDLRRFLHADQHEVAGNFFSTVRLRVSDPGNPAQVSRAIESAVTSTRPARALLATVLGRELFGMPERFPREIRAEPRARLVVNNLGESRALDSLAWKAPPEARLCACLIRPERAEDIVLVVLTLAEALHVSASFHGTTFAQEQVQLALDLALGDSLALLDDSGVPILRAP